MATLASVITSLPGVVIRDPAGLDSKAQAMRLAGPDSLQVIADFDRTLTKCFVNGKPGHSTHSIVEEGHPDLRDKGRVLFAKYHSLEVDPTIPSTTKFALMEEWWEQAHELMLQGGITKADIVSSVAEANAKFRDGVLPVFTVLDEKNIPVLIFSAGIADVIDELLRQNLPRHFANIRIVSNRMKFDEQGRLCGFQGRTIHVLNKNEHALELANSGNSKEASANVHGDGENGAAASEAKDGREETDSARRTNLRGSNSSEYNDPAGMSDLKKRTNVILLGDHLGDLGMSEGVDMTCQIAVGFLNHDTDLHLESYSRAFDVVVLNDGSMDVVEQLLHGILERE